MKKKMRIGIAHKDIGGVEHGGICTLYKNLASELNILGCEVHILTTRTDWHPFGIHLHQISLKDDDKIAYSERVSQRLEELDLDVVECSTWGYELLTYARLHHWKAKVVVRGDLSAVTIGATLHGRFEKELLDLADAKAFVSRFAKRDLERQYGKQVGPVIYL